MKYKNLHKIIKIKIQNSACNFCILNKLYYLCLNTNIMKGTSDDLKQAILTLADFCEVGSGYRKRLEFEGFASPEMVKDIIAELFLCAFDPKDCSKELYEAYMTVYEYYVELRSYGYVKFGN